MNDHLYIYTDGSTFRANPGPMSWAIVYVLNNRVMQQNNLDWVEVGAAAYGTNNRAELMGVIWALERGPQQTFTIRSDSMITLKCACGEYRRRSNLDLWHRFDQALAKRHERGVETFFEYVKGHDADEFNRMADKLAGQHAQANFACIAQENALS